MKNHFSGESNKLEQKSIEKPFSNWKTVIEKNNTGYYKFVDSLQIALYVTEKNGKSGETWVSKKIAELTGFSEKELKNRAFWYSRIHPKHRKSVIEAFNNLTHKDQIEISYQWKTADNSYIWIKDRAVGNKDKNGKLFQIIGIWEDISKEKILNDEFTKQESFLLTIVQNVPDILFLKDAKELRYRKINKAGSIFFGLTPDEIHGKTDFDLYPEKIAKTFENAERQVIETCQTLDFTTEEIISPVFGKRFHKRKIIPLCKNGNKPNFLMGISRDVTEEYNTSLDLQASEEKYKNLYETLPVGIAITTIEGRWLNANESFFKITGYSKEDLPNLKMSDVYVNFNDRNEMVQKFIREGFVENFETQIQHKSGNIIDVTLNINSFDIDNKSTLLSIIKDVTEEKRASNELFQSREDYRLFFEQDLTGDFLSTADGKLLNCNPAYLAMLGFKSIEEAKNFDLKKLYPNPHERQKIVRLLKEKGQIKNHEYQMVRLDGKPVHLIANILGEFDKNGKLERIKGYMFDNTTRYKAQSEIRKLSRAVEQSPASVVITDTNGIIEYVNQKFTEVTGYSSAEVVGKNPRILKSGQTSKGEYKKMWETILGGNKWRGEFLNKKKDGTLYWEDATITQIRDNDGKISHFLAIKADITLKKQSEQIQRVVFNISSIANSTGTLEELLHDIREQLLTVIDASNFYVALYDKEKDYISIPYSSDEKDNIVEFPAGKTLTKYVISTRKPLLASRDELDEMDRQGVIETIGEKAMEWVGVPLSVNGDVTGIFAVQSYENKKSFTKRDVEILEYVSHKISQAIERKATEQKLKDALQKAQESDRLKSAFLATMSHELRTPLNAVIGFSDLITNNSNLEEVSEFAQIINTSGNQLLSIVDSILDVNLIEHGTIRTINTEFSINEALKDILDTMKIIQQKEKKGKINIELEIPDTSSEMIIKADQKKLTQVLIGLLKNALKFTQEGNISFGYQIPVHENPRIEFFVKDTGIGIAREKQKIIFDLFRQIDDSHTRKYGGIGIGLTVAKKLVELMGGKIRVKSSIGEGTNFFFWIPLVEIKKSVSAAIPRGKYRNRVNLNLPDKTILIAEDEISNFELLKTYLEKSGVKIQWAKNGREVVEMCKINNEIDLILMDLRMPEMNGFEATKIVKKEFPGITIIAQTAFGFNEDYEKAMEMGCDEYLTKPIKQNDLFELLNKHLV